MYVEKKFNIVGFGIHGSSPWKPTKHCIIHVGTALVSKLDEPGVLWCPQCGMPYKEEDTAKEERFVPESGPSNRPQIISAKNKSKKYYDKQGNEINDPDLIEEIKRGMNVISYHEEKVSEQQKEKPHVVRK